MTAKLVEKEARGAGAHTPLRAYIQRHLSKNGPHVYVSEVLFLGSSIQYNPYASKQARSS